MAGIDKAKFDRLLYLKALNYTELAELAGVQVMTISKMANGKTTPRAATLRKITKELDCQPVDILEEVKA